MTKEAEKSWYKLCSYNGTLLDWLPGICRKYMTKKEKNKLNHQYHQARNEWRYVAMSLNEIRQHFASDKKPQ